jgi:hypothetical protein
LGLPSIFASLFTAAQRGEECQTILPSTLAIGLAPPAGEEEGSEIAAESAPGNGTRAARSMVPRDSYETEGAEGDCDRGASHEITPVATIRIDTMLRGIRLIFSWRNFSGRTT